jgi:hypothetical protein
LIDVRDIEEVGTGPLMEELGLDEATAQIVVDRCTEEAKIVATEQEAKKAAEAAAKAADRAALEAAGMKGIDAVGTSNPLLQSPLPADEPVEESAADKMPSALESSEGAAPEIVTHDENAVAEGSDLSPEEQAIHGLGEDQNATPQRKDVEDENEDAAALAEGRVEPPAGEPA